MRPVTIRERVSYIEQKLSKVDRDTDPDLYDGLLLKLYNVLFSEEGMRYFHSIYQALGAGNTYLANETEDYLIDLWLETRTCYEPSSGHLFSFLTSRMRNRVIDGMRKNGGIVGLPRSGEERKRTVLTSSDAAPRKDESDGHGISILNQMNNGFTEYGNARNMDKTAIMDAQLHELSSQILHYAEYHPDKRSTDRTFLYYKICYSADIINYLKQTCDPSVFWHERDAMEAMHFRFTNFCTEIEDRYRDRSELSVSAIVKKQLARKGDVLPEDRITDKNREEKLDIPLHNEVLRGYLTREECIKISSSAVSNAIKKYRRDMYRRLRDKELDYASIVMPG